MAFPANPSIDDTHVEFGKTYTFDGVKWTASEVAGAAGETITAYKFTATSGQTAFTGTDDGGATLDISSGNAIVTLNGVVLEETTDYTKTSTTVTLLSAAGTDDEVNVLVFSKFDVANVDTDKITEGNSSVEVVDTGTGHVAVTVDGVEKARFTPTGFGIGSSSPSTVFELNIGGSLAYFTRTAGDDGSVGPAIGLGTSSAGTRFYNYGTGLDFYMGAVGGSASLQARLDSSGNLQFNSGYGSAATAYGCRAWVKYDGTTTIEASGNVSSLADNGTGDTTVNFSNAMPDNNYAYAGMGVSNTRVVARVSSSSSSIRLINYDIAISATTAGDDTVAVAIFR